MNKQFPDQLKELNQSLKRKVYRLHNVVDAALQLNSVLDERQIVQTYLLNLFGLVSTKSIIILTADTPQSQLLTPFYFQGIEKENADRLALQRNDSFFELFRLHNGCVSVHRQSAFTDHSSYLRIVAELDGQLLAPLTYRDHRFGMVIIGNKHNRQPYSGSEIEIFKLLTQFLAVALANAKVYRTMEQISLTDPLTGLFNRRYLERFLGSEVARAERFNHPFSLVMMDVDNFKNYNDQLGHTTGDDLLKNLAAVVANTSRTSDVVARYGGEEFCVLLPEIDESGAKKFSERLRDIIFEHPFRQREIQPGGRISVSMGTATFPADARLTTELIDKADMAMYEAKRSGGNRVAVYSYISTS